MFDKGQRRLLKQLSLRVRSTFIVCLEHIKAAGAGVHVTNPRTITIVLASQEEDLATLGWTNSAFRADGD
jgi:hypothetical protein